MPLPRYAPVTNLDRAKWAETALKAFQKETGADDEDAVSDLLANLMHLCRLQPDKYCRNGGYLTGFDGEMSRAIDHYMAELDEDAD